MTPSEQESLIEDLLEGDISEADFLRLEAEMIVSKEARQAYYEQQKLQTTLEIESENLAAESSLAGPTTSGSSPKRTLDWTVFGGVAALLVFVGLLGWRIGQDTKQAERTTAEPIASGFGVVANQSLAKWSGNSSLAKGELLPLGPHTLTSGATQLELFSGVILVLEGESQFEVVSSMEISLSRGKMRVQVPKPAEGFRIRTNAGVVILDESDLAMEVTSGNADLAVVQGTAEWRVPSQEPLSLTRGESIRWDIATSTGTALPPEGQSRLQSLKRDLSGTRNHRLKAWEEFSNQLRSDPRLLAYFPIHQAGENRQLKDASKNRNDGTIVLAKHASDRWGRSDRGLDFSPTGSRVRLTISGEYQSLTLMCWVKIDSLDRWYNSLFLTDGHELNEPHWQIMNDGRLFFSVKAREAAKKDGDKHIAYSPPIWTPAQSGQWMHIATVYDGDAATTTHYVNGKAISMDQIPEKMQIEKVNIGPASIGNWGQPKRDDPAFAVRNLNGTIDEFAAFSAALSATEISEIYETGKP